MFQEGDYGKARMWGAVGNVSFIWDASMLLPDKYLKDLIDLSLCRLGYIQYNRRLVGHPFWSSCAV